MTAGNPVLHRHRIGLTRREYLQIGYSGLLGLGASQLAEAAARTRPGRGRAKSIILVFLTGGPSHIDTFDPKPDSPAEIRGDFTTIPTAIPGVRFSEYLPGFAKRMNQFALVRSMSHKNASHLPGTHWMMTGTPMPGIPISQGIDKIRSRNDWPCYGAGIDYHFPRTDGIPNAVHLPTYLIEGPLLWPGQYAGCMGARHDPWQIRDDPNNPNFRIENLSPPEGFALERLGRRRSLLDAVNEQQDRLSNLAETQPLSDTQKNAFALLTASKFTHAFRVDQEPAQLRDRYGRHMFGQSLLLARRLVESGVRMVQANMGIVQTWDTHVNNWVVLRDRLLPAVDKGVSALMDDLKDRGMLDDTLVIVTGEFGRTPKISTLAGQTLPGRDHWCEAFSSLFAGAGVQGGQVIGSTDASGAYVTADQFTAMDLGATVYDSLGIRPDSEFIDQAGRPLVLNHGQVIEPLYSGRGSI